MAANKQGKPGQKLLKVQIGTNIKKATTRESPSLLFSQLGRIRSGFGFFTRLLIHHRHFHHVQLVRVFVDVSLQLYMMTFMSLYVFRILERPPLVVFVGGKGLTVIADFSGNRLQGWIRRTAACCALLISARRAATRLSRVNSNDEEGENRQYECDFLHV